VKKTKQLTAVEWLDDKIIGLDVEFDMTLISRETYWVRRKEILEQANNMFEQQIMDAHNQGYADGYRDNGNSPIHYFTETFNKQTIIK